METNNHVLKARQHQHKTHTHTVDANQRMASRKRLDDMDTLYAMVRTTEHTWSVDDMARVDGSYLSDYRAYLLLTYCHI